MHASGDAGASDIHVQHLHHSTSPPLIGGTGATHRKEADRRGASAEAPPLAIWPRRPIAADERRVSPPALLQIPLVDPQVMRLPPEATGDVPCSSRIPDAQDLYRLRTPRSVKSTRAHRQPLPVQFVTNQQAAKAPASSILHRQSRANLWSGPALPGGPSPYLPAALPSAPSLSHPPACPQKGLSIISNICSITKWDHPLEWLRRVGPAACGRPGINHGQSPTTRYLQTRTA